MRAALARLREVDRARARPAVDETDQRRGDLPADGRLRLLGRPANVRRQDHVGQALQLCARTCAEVDGLPLLSTTLRCDYICMAGALLKR